MYYITSHDSFLHYDPLFTGYIFLGTVVENCCKELLVGAVAVCVCFYDAGVMRMPCPPKI